MWLEALASSMPPPGGGTAAALNAAIGAALIEMACSLTIGRPR
jgi:methenyltetrahydrofolate cyclohydrolase